MQRRYNSLRVVSAIYKLASIVITVFSIISFIFALYVALARPEAFYPTNVPNAYSWILVMGAAFFFIGLFLALIAFGTGTLIDLTLAQEEHLRASRFYLKRLTEQARRRDPPPSQPIRSMPPPPTRQGSPVQGTRPITPPQP